ncbi:MAG TPA: hypothetical protein VGR27_01335 [Longimicrobiaceae bacterium]|nr:hypothetical protein [Longimicrobiaceae bacterium]
MALAALVGLAGACDRSASPAPARLISGDVLVLGEGSARSWITLDGEGNPSALGVTLTEAARSASAALAPARLTLAAGARVAPFDHVEVQWRPGGPLSEDLFEEAHLDVRFSLFSAEGRDALTDSAAAVRVPSLDRVPVSYIPVPRRVPRLGAYWIDPTTPAYSSPHFSDALLYGFYDGEMVALEPKLSRRLLESRHSLTRGLKLPRSYARPGYYPTRYHVGYDPTTREYTVALEGLVLRKSGSTGRER